jgi:YHS domain-containing protein
MLHLLTLAASVAVVGASVVDVGGGTKGSAAPPELTLRHDVVRLLAGEVVAGREDLVVEREGIAYTFADEHSLSTFHADPERYEVADGGACGSMGPLSGLGDAGRYTVHDGRVYLFASDACRERFLKDPGRCIETDNPVPVSDDESAARGRATMDALLAWAGGREAVAGVRTFRAIATRHETHGDKDWTIHNELAARFPDHLMAAEQWNNLRYTTVSTPEGGAMGGMAGIDPIASSRTRAFRRAMSRELIVLVHAYATGAAEGEQPGMVIVSDGQGEINGVQVERVAVAYNGATSIISVERSTGRPLRLEFQGRDVTSSVGLIARDYSRSATIDGITLPAAYTVSLDGKLLTRGGHDFGVIEINPSLPAETFALREQP